MSDRKVYTAEEIINLPELKEEGDIIQNLLPSGLTILAAKPKVGKSILATQVAISSVSGIPLFGEFQARKSSCLYLCLEETKYDMQKRLKNYKKDVDHVDLQNLNFRFNWIPPSRGGFDLLDNMLSEKPQYKLVVIDTYGKSRDDGKGKGFSYSKDYSELSGFKDIADVHQVAIFLLHHTVKASYKDWLSNMYGSVGIAAACDTSWFLDRKRGEDDAILKITGRKTPDQSYIVKLIGNGTCWKYSDEYKDAGLSPEREELLYILGEINSPARLQEIVKRLKKKHAITHKLLKELINQELVNRPKRGVYMLTSKGKDALRLLED